MQLARYTDQPTLDSIWINDHIGLPANFEHNPYGVLLGTGVGYVEEEFRALGVPKRERRKINDAIPAIIKAAGDGWMPVGFSPSDLKPHIAELQRLATIAGRPPLAVVQMKTLPLEDPLLRLHWHERIVMWVLLI